MTHNIRGFNSWPSGFITFRLMEKKDSVKKGHGGGNCSVYGSQEVKKKNRRHQRADMSFQGLPLVAQFLSQASQFHDLMRSEPS